MQTLSNIELDLVSGGDHILVVAAPAHYVADRQSTSPAFDGHINIPARSIVTNHRDIMTSGGLGDICN